MKLSDLNTIAVLSVTLFLSFFANASAVERAPRITDREIVEKLAKLEAGQQALNKRIDDLRAEMKAGQQALSKRMDDLMLTMLTLFSAIVALIIGIFAYITWDRRTMMRPMLERLDRLEKIVVRDMDIDHEDGSLVKRMRQAMREYSRHDPRFAEILKHLSLLIKL